MVGRPVLGLAPGAAEVWVEIDEEGHVHRELAFDVAGSVVHAKPWRLFKRGEYGLFDGPPLDPDVALRHGDVEEVATDGFDRAWAAASIVERASGR